jgi:hypothetical protein
MDIWFHWLSMPLAYERPCRRGGTETRGSEEPPNVQDKKLWVNVKYLSVILYPISIFIHNLHTHTHTHICKQYLILKYGGIAILLHSLQLDSVLLREGSVQDASYDPARVYMYIYRHIYIHMYNHTHTHTHIYIYTHTRICTPTHTYMYVCMYIYTYRKAVFEFNVWWYSDSVQLDSVLIENSVPGCQF